MKKQKILMALLSSVAMFSSENASAADFDAAQYHPAEVDDLSFAGVFMGINMNHASDLYRSLLGVPGFVETPVLRFFDFLAAYSGHGDLAQNQMGYHLASLVALGPKIADTLVAGNYSWVLGSDKEDDSFWTRTGEGRSVVTKRSADNLYAYFTNPANSVMRQHIWQIMKRVGFIIEGPDNVINPEFYNPAAVLAEMVNTSRTPVRIVIGGDSIPTYYKDVARLHERSARVDLNVYGSTGFLSSNQGAITIGVDHRERPKILTIALDPNLWARINPDLVDSIDLRPSRITFDAMFAVIHEVRPELSAKIID